MTYFKLSLLRYLVLTNCFFYAYSSNCDSPIESFNSDKELETKSKPKTGEKVLLNKNKKVPIDIYLLLDESKITELEEVKLETALLNFLNNVKNYEQDSKNDAFGGTLIKCTMNQEIELLLGNVENNNSKSYCYFEGDKMIKCMRRGLLGLINDCVEVKKDYFYSKKILYESLLTILDNGFDEKYECCLLFSKKNKSDGFDFYNDFRPTALGGRLARFFENNYGNCKDKFDCIERIKVFLKYKKGFNDFCKCFINYCFDDFSKQARYLRGQINIYKNVNKDEQNLKEGIDNNSILNELLEINTKLCGFSDDIKRTIELGIDLLSKEGKIDFVKIGKYIKGQNVALGDSLKKIKKAFGDEVLGKLYQVNKEENKKESEKEIKNKKKRN